VRFQAAFALGESERAGPLAAIAARDAADPWIRIAVLSSCTRLADKVLAELVKNTGFLAQPSAPPWLAELATIVGARNQAEDLQRVLDLAAELPPGGPPQSSIVLGLGTGLQRAGRSLLEARAAASAAAAGMLTEMLDTATRVAADSQATLGERTAAVRLLGCAGSGHAPEVLARLVDAAQPESLQLLALQTLSAQGESPVAPALVAAWQRATPNVQEAILAALASRPAWARTLLDACARGTIAPGQVSGPTRAALCNHANADIRQGAAELFAAGAGPRHEVLAAYRSALDLAGDAARGDKVFERECQSCHKLGERGFQVGPNLALVRNRTPAALLEAILDPNREVQPRYVNYVLVDSSGRTVTGLVVDDSATSVTLARDKGTSETVLKSHIDEIKSTGQSLMPEGLEKTIDAQSMADLLAFLKQMQYDVGTLPDFASPEK
jgi:putative heme-binding domain-containing protein